MSEAVGARERFLRTEDRRRELASWGLSLAFFIVLTICFLLAGLLRPGELDRLPSPVYLTLEEGGLEEAASPAPGPESMGETPPPGTAELAPASAAIPVPTPRPAAKVTPAPATAPAAERAPTSPAPRETVPETRVPAASPKHAPVAAPAPTEARAAMEGASTLQQTAQSSALPAATPLTGIPEASPNQTWRTSEKGNSADTYFSAEAGKAGRNLYVPVYLFLPLPLAVDEALPDRFRDLQGFPAAERRKIFMKYYGRSDGAWRISGNVPLSAREQLWTILEDGGYDVARADFKARNPRPKPVTLRFTIAPAAEQGRPRLEKLELVSSSGYADIDEAVDWAFRKGSYFNATGEAITGSFTYRFD